VVPLVDLDGASIRILHHRQTAPLADLMLNEHWRSLLGYRSDGGLHGEDQKPGNELPDCLHEGARPRDGASLR
jgi:hypothetical protein